MSENTLLMPFLDESETFVLGFEIGQLWERIMGGESFDKQLIHTKNIQQVIVLCGTFGVAPKIEEYDSDWSYLSIKSLLP